MRNITSNPKYKLFFNTKNIYLYKENDLEYDYFENEVMLLELKKFDRKAIEIGLKNVWKESKYDEDFDYIDFSELCTKYGF